MAFRRFQNPRAGRPTRRHCRSASGIPGRSLGEVGCGASEVQMAADGIRFSRIPSADFVPKCSFWRRNGESRLPYAILGRRLDTDLATRPDRGTEHVSHGFGKAHQASSFFLGDLDEGQRVTVRRVGFQKHGFCGADGHERFKSLRVHCSKPAHRMLGHHREISVGGERRVPRRP